MEALYRKLAEFLERGETVAVATIIEVKGSVPREVGAKMIIHPLGQHVGTVGGGCGEADVIRAALDVLRTGQPTTVTVDLTEDISLQSTGVCGGIMQVYVERWRSDEPPAARQLIDAILRSIEERESVALVPLRSTRRAAALCCATGSSPRCPGGPLGLRWRPCRGRGLSRALRRPGLLRGCCCVSLGFRWVLWLAPSVP